MSTATADDFSIVEYYSEHSGFRCGYCKSPNSNYNHGMWAHSLSVQDYQDLIDRGWRRSGCYCYKPTLHLTCCPMYTIKCSVLDFKLSKSQKKKLKLFNKFLAHGRSKSATEDVEMESNSECGDDFTNDCTINDIPELKEKSEKAQANISSTIVSTVEDTLKERFSGAVMDKYITQDVTAPSVSAPCDTSKEGPVLEKDRGSSSKSVKKATRPGDGMDPNRPQCKKAKLLRKERKEKKLAQMGSLPTTEQKQPAPAAKSLEDFINEHLLDSPAHRLEIRLVRSCPASKEFKSTLKAAFEVYQRYQMTIHNDPPEKLTEKQFARFLVNSPLKPWKPRDGPPQGYGSFHQQYWLDGRLIAVGVIDILPYCVSSVYFFYDPEFHFLVLGTYGSLREIAFCRSLYHSAPSLRYYYMGYYIHSCPKMRYKGAYSPSYLLCPEVYSWHPIESCLPLLERNKYSRFNEDPQAQDPDKVTSIQRVSILFHNEAMTYQRFILLNPAMNHLQEVREYANLVGNKLSKRMLLLFLQ